MSVTTAPFCLAYQPDSTVGERLRTAFAEEMFSQVFETFFPSQSSITIFIVWMISITSNISVSCSLSSRVGCCCLRLQQLPLKMRLIFLASVEVQSSWCLCPWNVERGTGHLGRVQKRGESMQGCNEEGQGSPGIEAGKGCQKQQEGLLQLHQQQKEG